MRHTELWKQNVRALVSLPAYVALRPLLKLGGRLRKHADGPWVFGGHSGRLYADNAAALHARASELGREVRFVVQDEALAQELRARGYQPLLRNSLAARLAIENAELLAYSHGFSDLDHVLAYAVKPRALRVHLNHSLAFLKAAQVTKQAKASRDPGFDHKLAVTARERANLRRLVPGHEERVLLGGGAHLDAFMRQRGRAPRRTLVYCPTHRDTPAARARLECELQQLVAHPRLHALLERDDLYLEVVAHINRAAHLTDAPAAEHPRVRRVPPHALLESLLHGAAFISDYSGLLFDQLALGRPTIFFPFDREQYLAERELFIDYNELDWGPRVESVEALVALLESGSYRDLAPYAARRAHWESVCFPRLTPGYADHSLQTIDALLARRRGDVCAVTVQQVSAENDAHSAAARAL